MLRNRMVPLLGGGGWGYGGSLLATGQTTQYNSELDDGYYKKGIVKSYTINTTGAQAGTTNVDLAHLVSDTGAFTAAGQTYTDAGKCGVFKAAGGETIVITGSGSNNGTFTTVSATVNTVVFASGIVNEADAPMTTFAKREAISNNTVLDNNTGLTWMRYSSVKMGIIGTGLMPWTGVPYDIFAFCAAANAVALGGYGDWRIPNINELMGLADFEAPNALPNPTAFPASLVCSFSQRWIMLPDLKSQTLAQLRVKIVPSKRDALIILTGSDKVSDEPVRKYRKDGQIESQVETVRDVETDAVVSGRTITWTYYDDEKDAPVDTITIVETDANGKEVSRKVIKHFLDGRQPELVINFVLQETVGILEKVANSTIYRTVLALPRGKPDQAKLATWMKNTWCAVINWIRQKVAGTK